MKIPSVNLLLCIFIFLPLAGFSDTSSESSIGDGLSCPPGFSRHSGYFCKGKLKEHMFCTICNTCGDQYFLPSDGEECDDGGNNNSNAKCNKNCKKTFCGDEIIQNPNGFGLQEQCDEGAGNLANASCNENCQLTKCGDGVVQSPNGLGEAEECDLGESNGAGSGCSSDCKKTKCGDGFLQRPNGDGVNEECDGEEFFAGYPELKFCQSDCTVAYCGNEVREEAEDYQEECDYQDIAQEILDIDANAVCQDDCTAKYCGNSVLETGEDCDEGPNGGEWICTDDEPTSYCSKCSAECTIEKSKCGDGIVQGGEDCDEGPNGGEWICTDDEPTSYCSKCTGECTLDELFCGDGIVQGNEECDEGENNGLSVESGQEYCSTTCTLEDGKCKYTRLSHVFSDRYSNRYKRLVQTRPKRLREGAEEVTQQAYECLEEILNPKYKFSSTHYARGEDEYLRKLLKEAGYNFGDYITADCKIHNGPVLKEEFCGSLYFYNHPSPISLILPGLDSINEEWTLVKFRHDPQIDAQWGYWKASGQAPLLVFDPENTGKVTSGVQLFGNYTFGKKTGALKSSLNKDGRNVIWKDGFEALRSLDTNGDSQLSGDELKDISLWFDHNRNAISEEGEVIRALDYGITSISTQSDYQDLRGDIYALYGYQITKDGKSFSGKLVDWYTETFGSQQWQALEHLSSNSVNLAEEDVEVKQESVQSVKDVNLTGVYFWKSEEEFNDYTPGGVFFIDDLGDRVEGVSMSPIPLDDNDDNYIAHLAKYELKGKKVVENGETILKLEVFSKSGVFNSNVIVEEGTLRGQTATGVENHNRETRVSYSWVAKKIGSNK